MNKPFLHSECKSRDRERQSSRMVAFRWIQMSSFLILMLQLQGTTEQHSSVGPVRAGQDVTLHCKNMIQQQHECYSTTWLFSGSGSSVELVAHGEIKNNTKTKSDRLSVTANCSLVIKKVTSENAGPYTCRQFKTKGGPQEGPDSVVDLSVINTTTTVKVKTSEGTPTEEPKQPKEGWLWSIIAPVALAVVLLIIVLIIRWKKTKENKTNVDENTGLSLNPAETQSVPGTSQNTAEAEDGVSYASISFTRKTKSEPQAHGGKYDDDDDTVTYSTVRASSSSAGVSSDPSNLYSTVNKPRK